LRSAGPACAPQQRLLRPQRRQRVDLGGLPSCQVAGKKRDHSQQHLANFCRETLQVERALLRTLVERATERAFHPSYHLTPTG
jgi:hypothetical protein